jgi:hypothetical protein
MSNVTGQGSLSASPLLTVHALCVCFHDQRLFACSLRNDVVNHISRHVRQPEVAAAVAVGELRVVDAQ